MRATARDMQLAKQIGEYLVASELARQGLLVATFSGNVPDFDIVATDERGSSIPIQVKAIRGGSWQFHATKFVAITFNGRKQVLGKLVKPRKTQQICVLVLIQESGKDRFFVCTWEQLRNMAVSKYKAWLAEHDNVRPYKYDSLHCSLLPTDLEGQFEGKWDSITNKLR